MFIFGDEPQLPSIGYFHQAVRAISSISFCLLKQLFPSPWGPNLSICVPVFVNRSLLKMVAIIEIVK